MKTETQIISRIEKWQKEYDAVKGKNIDSHKTRVLFGAIIDELKKILEDGDYKN